MSLSDIINFVAVDEELATGGQPTEEQLRDLQTAGVEAVINLGLLDPHYCLADEAGVLQRLGIAYHHIPVQFAAPLQPDFDAFVRAMHACAGKRVFVHCAMNIRVTAFVAMYGLHELGWPPENVEHWATLLWQPNPVWRAFLDAVSASRPESG